MLVQLPNGFLDGPDLFNYVEVDELRGKQQNYLANKDLVVGNIGHVPKILEDMILSLQTKQGLKWKGDISELVWKLPSGDLETILIKIRENTFGPKFYHEAQCSHCSHVNKNLKLDLNKLEIDYMSIEDMTKSKTIKLPKCKKEVELKAIYLKDLFEVVKISSSKQDSLITSLVTVSIKSIDGKENVDSKQIEDIPVKDLVFLQDKLEEFKMEGHIDTNIQIKCSKCKEEFEVKLNCFDPSFFSHTRASTTSST